MKKLLLIALIILSTQACKSAHKIPNTVLKFVESSGKVEVEINRKGEWVKIKSTGAAQIISSKTLEETMTVATLRAKANLIEFLENEIRSSRSTESVVDSDSKKGVDPEIVSKISEKIYSDASGSLRGAYVSERKISKSQNYAKVTIILDRKIIKSIKMISIK